MSNIFNNIKTPLNDLYNEISGIFTLICAIAVAICSVGMVITKEQRTVEEFKSWRKRVFITWIVFNALGLIVSLGGSLTSNMQWSTSGNSSATTSTT